MAILIPVSQEDAVKLFTNTFLHALLIKLKALLAVFAIDTLLIISPSDPSAIIPYPGSLLTLLITPFFNNNIITGRGQLYATSCISNMVRFAYIKAINSDIIRADSSNTVSTNIADHYVFDFNTV